MDIDTDGVMDTVVDTVGQQRTSEWLSMLFTEEGQRAIDLFSAHLKKRQCVRTRHMLRSETVGCRWWQMVYAILMVVPYPAPSLLLRAWREGVSDPQYIQLIEVVKGAIDVIQSSPRSSLHRMLYGGEVLRCAGADEEKGISLPCMRDMDRSFIDTAEDGRYYACLYHSTADQGLIDHYFVLIRHEGRWYVSSSYGSEWVHVPLRTQEIPMEDLRAMVGAMEEGVGVGNHRRMLEGMFRRYFLDGGLRKLYSEEQYEGDPRLRGKVIPQAMGIQRELNTVLTAERSLRIGFIEHMEENMRDVVQYVLPVEGGGVSRRRSQSQRQRSSRSPRRRRSRSHRRSQRRRRSASVSRRRSRSQRRRRSARVRRGQTNRKGRKRRVRTYRSKRSGSKRSSRRIRTGR